MLKFIQKNKKLILIILLIAAIGGGILYYFSQSSNKEFREAPPSLEFGGGTGFIGIGTFATCSEDDKQEDANRTFHEKTDIKGIVPMQIPDSINEISVYELFDELIKCEDQQFMIAILKDNPDYDPSKNNNTKQIFYTYPKGPYKGTKTIENPNSYMLNGGEFFYLVTDKPVEYNELLSRKDATALANLNELGPNWHFLSANNINDFIAGCPNRIKSLYTWREYGWINEEGEKQEAGWFDVTDNPQFFDNNKIIAVNLTGEAGTCENVESNTTGEIEETSPSQSSEIEDFSNVDSKGQILNKASFMKILVTTIYDQEEIDSVNTANCFEDITGSEWFAKYACLAKEKNILRPGNDFNADETLSLVEGTRIIMLAFGFEWSEEGDPWYRDMIDVTSNFNYFPIDPDGYNPNGHEKMGFDVEFNKWKLEQMIGKIINDKQGKFYQFSKGTYYNGYDYESIEKNQREPELDINLPGDNHMIPNVMILDLPDDSEYRSDNGNANFEAILPLLDNEKLSAVDMLLFIKVGNFNGKFNGIGSTLFRKYLPKNIGKLDCRFDFCDTLPEKLRFFQSVGDNLYLETWVHEVGHYWTIGFYNLSYWGVNCFDSWVNDYLLENGHWTQFLQAGRNSVMNYAKVLESFEIPRYGAMPFGVWIDNNDGTFTMIKEKGDQYSWKRGTKFNDIDLYAMGLLSEEELETEEMFVITNPELIEGVTSLDNLTIKAQKEIITLEDLKQSLLEAEECAETGPNHYFTGDGSREKSDYDKEHYPDREFAEEFKVGVVLIKFPEQKISNRRARELCQIVNYTFPEAWSFATQGKSKLTTNLPGESATPNCADLYDFP
ncbi:hypothetical protein GF354_05695 [Candidatus Peregrinibacteria bacterium]|nr:hypothetical protein [Candidatus Peregrinibacteria bacterium]